MISRLRAVLSLLKHALPLVFCEAGGGSLCVTSAEHGHGVVSLSIICMPVDIYETWNSRVSTATLNLFLHEIQRVFPSPLMRQIAGTGTG